MKIDIYEIDPDLAGVDGGARLFDAIAPLPAKVLREASTGQSLREGTVVPLPGQGEKSPADAAPLRGLMSPANVRSGYVPRYPRFDAALNQVLAALALFAVAPVMLVLSVLVLVSSGRPVFYSGVRLGKDRKPFKILKFRTLLPAAAAQTSQSTLPRRTLLETNIGSYLRKSRLDELPQLINIVKGDMVFFGPRPVRPELLDLYMREAAGFGLRFNVKPGLVGMSQALLPHSAGKRLRGRFNSLCCRAPMNYWATLGFVLHVGLTVMRRAGRGVLDMALNLGSPAMQFNFLRSGFHRPRNTVAQFEMEGEVVTAGVVGISDQIVQFVSPLPPRRRSYALTVDRKLASGRHLRIEIKAEVKSVFPLGVGKSGFLCHASYAARTPYQRYRIERYLLDETVLST
ncbi:sugar transferase [Ruegeria pomeroyi]|uniref:Sugar transferase n=1 Tax=Ruegeria pomeroyi TaxID=89184 RepID=A0A9Q3WJF6_9RHOB|nr:sugar transferase [Ruegeria pomeroyi]MCE8536950.1 sugar transferase [Ruegeria pomeroyi]